MLSPATQARLAAIKHIDSSFTGPEVANMMALDLISGITTAIEAVETFVELGADLSGIDDYALDSLLDSAKSLQRKCAALASITPDNADQTAGQPVFDPK